MTAAEVPRRLPPTSDERVKAVVDTIASGSLGGSTLFARKPEVDVRSATRALVPSPPNGSVFSDANTLFVRWSGTLDAGDIIRTQDATPDTTDFGSTSILAYSAPGPVTPTVAALLYVGWELILDGPAASPWGAVAFYPSTNTSGDFSDHGETSTSHQTYAAIALAADHLLQAQLANLGGVDGIAYTITLRVQPIILL